MMGSFKVFDRLLNALTEGSEYVRQCVIRAGCIRSIETFAHWALLAGQQLRSKQTGYVHFHYGHVQPPFETIPLIENALFVLALLRSRIVEKMQEGMLLLKGLLGFQVHSQDENLGNFPLYLHQYPQCNDSTVALQLLAPFYWMMVQFGHVLGGSLRDALERAAELAIRHSVAAPPIKSFLIIWNCAWLVPICFWQVMGAG